MQHQDLVQICHEYGSPLYVYDAHVMEQQYTRLTRAFSAVPHLRINYAVKALSNLSVLKWMHQLGAGLDTVSIQEVQLGLAAGVAPHEIIYTPNGVSLSEIEAPGSRASAPHPPPTPRRERSPTPSRPSHAPATAAALSDQP